tara:strand:- start:11106 stop:13556 length:2451 start_codon:yes stop_codon:yes gene_type:complete
MYKKIFLLFFYLATSIIVFSQNISGTITNEKGNKLPSVNISIENTNIGTTSNYDGQYKINIPNNKSVVIIFSFIGYQFEKIRIPLLEKGENYILNIKLKRNSKILNDIIITDKEIRKNNITRIKPKHVNLLPGNAIGIEAILKTLPGVSSANELSSQYSVRGGNFDENLVYVNGIEIYRPFLLHSGQQEGLSFVNTNMVGNILFSAGGFSAKYGDKMSSVLDIKYKKPNKNRSNIELSLLGGSANIEGINKSKKFSYLLGFRYKTSKYLLNSMDTRADYNPRFYDIQNLISYKINSNWEISFLGNISSNKYEMIPQNRETEFGTINEALKINMFFEGKEIDSYETFFGAINTNYKPTKNLKLEFSSSIFNTYEQESFDIIGEYWLYQLDNSLGSNSFGEIAFDRGVGKHIKHARNNLHANVANFSHRGNYKNKIQDRINWGFKVQKENIKDKINEWVLIDSAFYNYPHPNDNIGNNADTNQQIILNETLKKSLDINSYRNTGYIELSKDIDNLTINAGYRASYWTFNEEFLFSPRSTIAYAPNWEKDIVFRFATGVYYQAPFYKELIDQKGIIKRNIKSQKSTHYLVASDYLFYKWDRPFKWSSEIYYKQLNNLIPYKIDNVRIQYLPNERSEGYATGIDIKINGEFVKGAESWISLSIMKTEENIIGDKKLNENGEELSVGFIPRPTDQRVNFSMFFQDYIPGNPNYKMNLNLIYGSGLPFGPPNSEKYQDILRIPAYRRVDIGFSILIKEENKFKKIRWLNKFDDIWISAEVFNLLNINNTVSYLWVKDISSREYAVPNYLTSRRINTKIIFSF